MVTMKDRIIVALDVDNEDIALELVNSLEKYVGGFKIGLELLNSVGIGLVHKIIGDGNHILYDAKFNDIPNTIAGASKAMARLAVNMFTVHTLGGLEMMKTAFISSKEEAEKIGVQRPQILGVTVLTSINQNMLNEQLLVSGNLSDYVVHLALLAHQAGLDGIVASPQEIRLVRKTIPENMLIVTPGVRPTWASNYDQKRTATPHDAIKMGADRLVIGRPITKPPQEIGKPIDAVSRILEEISSTVGS